MDIANTKLNMQSNTNTLQVSTASPAWTYVPYTQTAGTYSELTNSLLYLDHQTLKVMVKEVLTDIFAEVLGKAE